MLNQLLLLSSFILYFTQIYLNIIVVNYPRFIDLLYSFPMSLAEIINVEENETTSTSLSTALLILRGRWIPDRVEQLQKINLNFIK
ncbi:hypothetical protein PPL_04330 [Heterostelium album PN500]|uniref:Uncharacterized protein n=1 Tax=Heterostelium pallidum (strain ATCC 26659 / Pp 5 / PN500) TaxID=670386 RepID=D3B794_HETP5|nr:hypothetical protein PPL_04330 [Heterostelium album PN500]EFA82637.1 hypothetical protein PPL_04330 [Heterostelium album PN500]|eukprot:XP_020434754.1 hypothetical protein PPL_04330 [Heterostelium album PN500]